MREVVLMLVVVELFLSLFDEILLLLLISFPRSFNTLNSSQALDFVGDDDGDGGDVTGESDDGGGDVTGESDDDGGKDDDCGKDDENGNGDDGGRDDDDDKLVMTSERGRRM